MFLKRRVVLAFPPLLLAALGVANMSVQRAYGAGGIKAHRGRLIEADGGNLVLRGVNHGYAFGAGPPSVFADIKSTGANAVRVALSSGHQWPATTPAEVASVIARCKANRLICVLDVHDTVGAGQQPGAATMTEAVDYWLSLKPILDRQEAFVIINVANEPSGYGVQLDWPGDTATAIRRLRAAGFQHALMVDAPDWGNDHFGVMHDHAADVFAADPEHNTIFDIHMYGPFNSPEKVSGYLDGFVARQLPVIVGEFSALHQYGDPDEDAIMAYCQAHGLSYLGWSWSGNSAEYSYLDVVEGYRPGRLTSWGQRLVNGANGIRATSRQAGIFGGFWPDVSL